MVEQQTCQSDEGWSYNLYLLGCCTIGPLIGLAVLIGLWVHPALLALFTLTFSALSGSYDFWLFDLAKYFFGVILIVSLITRFAGKKVFD